MLEGYEQFFSFLSNLCYRYKKYKKSGILCWLDWALMSNFNLADTRLVHKAVQKLQCYFATFRKAKVTPFCLPSIKLEKLKCPPKSKITFILLSLPLFKIKLVKTKAGSREQN